MTIAAIQPVVYYTGNGATTDFPFTFEIPTTDDLEVTVIEIATQERTFIDPSDFNVTGIGDPDGGSIEYPLVGSPLSSSFQMRIQRLAPYEQTTSYSTQGNFSPETLENALDYVTMLIQQVFSIIRGTNGIFRFAVVSVSDLPSAVAGAPGLVYVWDAAGGGIPCFSDGTNWRRIDTREIVS